MEGWVGLVWWPIADTLPTKWSYVNHRSGKVHQSKTDVLTTKPRHQLCYIHSPITYKLYQKSHTVGNFFLIMTSSQTANLHLGSQSAVAVQCSRLELLSTMPVVALACVAETSCVFLATQHYCSLVNTQTCATRKTHVQSDFVWLLH